jgi:hypothetical protein
MWLSAAVVVAAAGAADAAVGSVWDQFAILVLVIVMLAMALATMMTNRPSVPIRADLVRWLRTRSAVEGEPVESLADRAIASYREHLRPGANGPP